MEDPAGRIFLSYRREDTRHMAGRLADRLNFRFGPGTVFMDVDAIEPGADFMKSIAEAVGSCDLLIALIGRDWLVLDERTGEPRIHEYDDFVAIEIKAALDRGIYVIPVLVDQAKMPTSAELPASLRPLATRNATRIDHETFSSDVERFLSAVERILRTVAAERTARHRQYAPPDQPPARSLDQTDRHPEPPQVPSHRLRQHPASQPATPWPPAPGFIGTPGSDTRSPENPPPVSGPRIPPGRTTLRIALWWATYIISIFAAFVIFSTIAWPGQAKAYGSIVFIVFILAVLLGVAALLSREIKVQRYTLRQFGPDGEAFLSRSAVSAKHVRKVAVICAAVVAGFGLLVAATPPTTSSGTGTSTVP
jgi:hypothetical protein